MRHGRLVDLHPPTKKEVKKLKIKTKILKTV
jgi:hypothetical protein